MRISPTLSWYLAKTYFLNMLLLLFGLLAIIYLFDTVELLRRAGKRGEVPLSLVLQMGLLKLPEVGQLLFPFAVLFSAMFTFWQLTIRSELVVVRSAGVSAWQFLAPIVSVAIFVGVLQVTVINPIGAVFVAKFEQLENTHLNYQQNQIAVFKEGLWLRQSVNEDENQKDGYLILHAETINQENWTLRNVTVLSFSGSDDFLARIDAKTAQLEKGRWVFQDLNIHQPQAKERHLSKLALATELTVQDIEESFAPSKTMSFWRLPSYIKTLEKTGFDATHLRIYYHNLLSQPFMLVAMVLLAAIVSMRPQRQRGGFILIVSGVFIGFFVFFMSSFLQALGASGQIPVLLAAWAPAFICLLLGASVMLNLEDG